MEELNFDGIELRQVKQFPNYYVSRGGEVYSLAKGNLKKISPRTTTTGLRQIQAYIAGKHTTISVATLVGHAFLEGPKKKFVRHLDFNRSNDAVENLEWSDKRTGRPMSLKAKAKLLKKRVEQAAEKVDEISDQLEIDLEAR